MKKFAIVLSMFLISGGLLPIAMNAQNVNTNQTETEQTANAEAGKAKPGERKGKDGKKLHMSKEGKQRMEIDGKKNCDKKASFDKKDKKDFKKGDRRGGKRNPFKGIELSAEQKAKIEQLREKGKAEVQKVETEARTKKDKLREDFDNDLKKILTPEQWTQYEKNRNENKQMKQGKADRKHGEKAGKKGDHKKGKRDGKKGPNRGERQNDKARGSDASN